MRGITSGIRRRSIALLAASSLASASCTPLAVGGVVAGSLATVGGGAIVTVLDCKDNDTGEPNVMCSVKAMGTILMILGIVFLVAGGYYLIEYD
jgi:hypothetical protein